MKTARVLLWTASIVAGIALALNMPRIVADLAYSAYRGRSQAATEQLRDDLPLRVAFERVSDAIKPSVVSIDATRVYARMDPERQELMQRFFPFSPDERSLGMGTGVITHPNGVIVTNNHVIEDANRVEIRLASGRRYQARVIGADPATDLAVLKIDADDLVPAKLGNSDRLKVGQWVLAAGSPLGLDQTVTAGIVSAKGRANMGIADYEDFIQTDAAINPGNSGGPLLNLEGEVVGINTAIASRTGGYMGIGFAIPSKMVSKVVDNILEDGSVKRGLLGVRIQALDQERAEAFGLSSSTGVLIVGVLANSPASSAGLQPGDVILSVDGKKTATPNELRNKVAATTPGTEIELEVWRDNQLDTVTVTVEELQPAVTAERPQVLSSELVGMRLEVPDPLFRERLGIPADQSGLLITNIQEGSVADQSGLQVGDLIVEADGQPMEESSDLEQLLTTEKLQSGLSLRILRDSQPLEIQLSL